MDTFQSLSNMAATVGCKRKTVKLVRTVWMIAVGKIINQSYVEQDMSKRYDIVWRDYFIKVFCSFILENSSNVEIQSIFLLLIALDMSHTNILGHTTKQMVCKYQINQR